MSEVTMRFNKTDLRELIEIHDIQRDVGNNRSISIDHAPRIGVQNISRWTSPSGPKTEIPSSTSLRVFLMLMVLKN